MTARRVARTDELRPGDRVTLITQFGEFVRTVTDVRDVGEHESGSERAYRVSFAEPPTSEIDTGPARAGRAWLLTPEES